MELSRALEQHIAVLGESGSGKTVLVSAFYGAAQEPGWANQKQFHLLADRVGEGNKLHQNFLGMKNSDRLPATTRFAATSYSFSIKLMHGAASKAAAAQPFQALRLVWHDYPGEWFDGDVSGPEEARRRVDTFRELLGSDVALLLVDGQRLLDNVGEEERYLKALLTNVGNNLLSRKDELLDDGKPLVEFPRIWLLALSKADLLPDLDVIGFRDLVVEKAAGEIDHLRSVIAGLVEDSDALSVGEDFLLLSSARFEAGRIEVGERVGLDLVLPLAAMLPLERHARWVARQNVQSKVAENLLQGVGPIQEVLRGVLSGLPGPFGKLWKLVGPNVNLLTDWATERLREANAEASAKGDHLRAVLSRFGIDLDDAERDRVLMRSLR